MAVVITGSNTPTAGGVTYGDGTTYANTAAGSAGQALLSNGSSAPTWGTPAASTATTATNLASGSNGTIPYQSAVGTTQMLAVGSSGQVLTSGGVGAPSWTTPSAGAMVLISTLSGASTYYTWTGLSTYQRYVLLFNNIQCASSFNIGIRLGDSSTIYSADYYFGGSSKGSNNASALNQINGQAYDNFTVGGRTTTFSASGFGASGDVYIFAPTSNYPSVTSRCVGWNSTTQSINDYVNGGLALSITVTQIRILLSGGAITAGSASLYGISS